MDRAGSADLRVSVALAAKGTVVAIDSPGNEVGVILHSVNLLDI